MQCHVKHPYPCGLEEVYLYFRDEDSVVAKYEALGARNIEMIRNEENDNGFYSESKREIPADVPAMLKSLLGDYNQVVQKEHWYSEDDGSLGCDLIIDLVGVPVSIKGEMHLYDVDDGCINEVVLEIDSSIPLVGGSLSRFVAGDCNKSMEQEYRYILEAVKSHEASA
ncbi:DUF2505 domain-containing protein [Corallincola platygyrae]|uniref:DUF2505 domain-containing protein n=1 Tax=Corallincola platygyrae TaxID=1193278 RepID=A0ABW4XM56_9GAMM